MNLRSIPVVCALSGAVLPLLAGCRQDRTAYTGPYAAQVNVAVPAIERATGLKFKTPPRLENKSRDEVRSFLERRFDEEQPALELAGAEQAYKLFGLLPDSLNLRGFMLSLLAEQVVGYYDPQAKVLYVVGGAGGQAPTPEIVNITISHELVHALQDQYLGLDSLQKVHGDNDRQTAMQAVIEGQATFEQMSIMLGGSNFATRLPGGWDRVRGMIRDAQGTMPVFSTAPMIIQETLLFPYLSGAEFVRQFKAARPGQVPYRPLPSSTEQVMHPERYLDSLDTPTRVSLPKPVGAKVVYENDLGEFETRLLLYQFLQDVNAAARGAKGWAGDRYDVLSTPRGAGVAWVTVWDSAVDGAEFRDLMERVIERRYGVKAGAGPLEARRFAGKGRQVELVAATVQGRPLVMYTDVPAGASTRLIDVKSVKLEREK